MGRILVVLWLLLVLPAIIFAGGFVASSALNLAMQRILRGGEAASDSPQRTSDPSDT